VVTPQWIPRQAAQASQAARASYARQPYPTVQPPSVVQYVPPRAYPPPTSVPPVYAGSYRRAYGGPYVAPSANMAYASAAAYQPPYTLDAGDRLRVVVFGQDGISNSYIVDAGGHVNLPLIGAVPARGASPAQLARLIADKLRRGYVREPHVSVEVEAYRPFFILGEVTNPGQYAYVPNMTVQTAIAIAGGFAPRARKSDVELTRNGGGQNFHGKTPLTTALRPGDTVIVKERWF
jgi:polysaccharide export outer membrane protein